MKRFLLWIIGVVLGIALLLGAVMGVSYSFTSEGSLPLSGAAFGSVELEQNGYCWQLPLIGGKLNKVFANPTTLTVQKLGTLYEAHPELTLPEWVDHSTFTIQDQSGALLFEGTLDEYQDFLFPQNGEYKAQLTLWHSAGEEGRLAFENGSTGEIRRNAGLERPAKATGWYHYSFRFTLQASADIEFSAQRVEQGGIVGVRISGMTGDTAPTIETDLGSVQCLHCNDGWRAYIPAAYNTYSGDHVVNITIGSETTTHSIIVLPKEFGTVEVEAEQPATEQANSEFRNAVWALYDQPIREKMWRGGFICPAENSLTLVDFGQTKVVDGQQGSRSNSTLLYTIPGESCRAPANGVVVLAKELELTGKTVVIDHGFGVRSYLYGLQSILVTAGQTVEQGQSVGTLGEEMTMDFKLGSKSVNPWLLFQTSGGLFWKENG